jgi:hypothetical protein
MPLSYTAFFARLILLQIVFWKTKELLNFVVFDVLAGPVNSCVIYFLLKRRRKKVAEDEAWERQDAADD